MYRFFVILSALAVLSGCSLMPNSTLQTVEVVTPGVIGAECILKSPEYKFVMITPDDVLLERHKHDYTITCTKQGYRDAVVRLPAVMPEQNRWKAVRKLGLDFASGAVYEYPSYIEIEMEEVENIAAYEARKKWQWLEDWDSLDRGVQREILEERGYGTLDFKYKDSPGNSIELDENGDLRLPENIDAKQLEPQTVNAPVEEEVSASERFWGWVKKPSLQFVDEIEPSDVPAQPNN